RGLHRVAAHRRGGRHPGGAHEGPSRRGQGAGQDGHAHRGERPGWLRGRGRRRPPGLRHRAQPPRGGQRGRGGCHRRHRQGPGDAMSAPLAISIAPELERRVRLGVLALDGVSAVADDAALLAEAGAYARSLRERYGDGKSAEVPGAADARTLYKDLGLDPTKTRPSSEALLRRVLKGVALYRINVLADALNLCSLRAQLPFGLYDR